MKNLLIRLDDISPDMNWKRFDRARGILEQFQIKPIIGVVPDNQDATLSIDSPREDFWKLCLELQKQGWTIAQHGYQHTYTTEESGLLGINPFSEFAGLDYQTQYDRLKRGQSILHNHGIYAKIFMAPGHTYDGNTLKALHELGFTQLTDGYADRPYQRGGLTFIPCTLSKPKITSAVDTICLHVNEMADEEFEELEHFCSRQMGLFTSVDELLQNTKQIPQHGGKVAFIEWKNLKIRKLKAFIATNEIIQTYFERTDSEDTGKKKRKRVLGLPGLLFHLLLHIQYH